MLRGVSFARLKGQGKLERWPQSAKVVECCQLIQFMKESKKMSQKLTAKLDTGCSILDTRRESRIKNRESRHFLVLLTILLAAYGQQQVSAESRGTIVQKQRTTPSWLQEGPFIQARGNWEPLMFIVRRGHGFSFLRNLQERRGFADPSLKENWKALFNDEAIEHEKKAGSTYCLLKAV